MKCYKHHEADAVGLCKSCSKGVCVDCAVDLGKGLACKNSCEEEVQSLILLIERNKGSYNKASSAHNRNAFVYGGFGVIMILCGLFVMKEIAIYLIPAGLIFLIGMGLSINTALKYKKNN